MARIRLDIPEQLPYRTSIDVRITDLNYGAHLGNDRILVLVQEARARYLAELGISETNAFGIGMMMVDAAIQFKAEGFFRDTIDIEMGTKDLTHNSWDFIYRLVLRDKGNVLALVKTGMVAFDYSTRKVAEIPPALVAELNKLAVS